MFRQSRSALLSLAVTLAVAAWFAHPAEAGTGASVAKPNTVASSSLGQYSATFAGPAATGCNYYGCSLLTGPFFSPSTAPLASGEPAVTNPRTKSFLFSIPRVMPEPDARRYSRLPHTEAEAAVAVTPPTVRCEPMGPGCDTISVSSGGATGVMGLNAVDSGEQSTNILGVDIEPPDQGLCAGHGYVVEANNLGEILV